MLHLKFKIQMLTYLYTSPEFQKTRKSDDQLCPKQTSDDILGINTSLWQSPHEGKNSENYCRDNILAFYLSPPWSGGYSEAAAVSREWKFISQNHSTLYHSIPHEHVSLPIRGPRTQASLNNELPLILRGQVGERASVWIGWGSLWRAWKSMLTLQLHRSCIGWLTAVSSPPSWTHRCAQWNLPLL